MHFSFNVYPSAKLAHCPISGLETGNQESTIQRIAEKNQLHLQNYKYKCVMLALHLGLWLQSGVGGLSEQGFMTYIYSILL